MTKIVKIFCAFLILLVCGCSKEKYITCTNNINNKLENYELNATYKIYYENNFVTRIEKIEKYTSDDKRVIEYFEEYKTLDYDNYNDLYGGYTYTIKKDKYYVEIKTIIDMSELDIKKMVNDNKLDKNYTSSNKLKTTGAQYFYKDIGATCNEG